MTPHRVNTARLLDRLPHGSTFRFLTEVTTLVPGEMGQGRWALTGEEPFFAGHFPGNPVVPGVLIAESLAQLAGVAGFAAAGEGSGVGARLAHVDLKFPGAARPPVVLELWAKLVRELGVLRLFEVRAEAGGTIVASGSLMLAAFEGGEGPA